MGIICAAMAHRFGLFLSVVILVAGLILDLEMHLDSASDARFMAFVVAVAAAVYAFIRGLGWAVSGK